MKILQPITGILLLASLASAQEIVREYGFLAITPSNASSTPTTYGILPASPVTATTVPTSSTYYAGGLGVVWRLGREGQLQRIGVGVDLLALFPSSGKIGSEVAANLGANGYYHFYSTSNLDVFVTGGYAGMFRDFAANGFNGGGGVNYWFGGGTLGAMFEVRELVFSSSPSLQATHYTEIRIGFVHRSK